MKQHAISGSVLLLLIAISLAIYRIPLTGTHTAAVAEALPGESASVQTQTPAQPQVAATSSAAYPVIAVVDGDTFKIRKDGATTTLRLIGLDTPEIVDPRKPVQCFGAEASARAHALLDGQRVRIETDPTQDTYDKYGRLLVYAYLPDGTLFNEEMILEGYGHEYTYDKPYEFQAQFKAAQAAAEQAGRGLWAPGVCAK